MKFVLASHNRGKLKEMQEILSRLGVEVVLESDLGLALDVEETGTTFAENAALKAGLTADARAFDEENRGLFEMVHRNNRIRAPFEETFYYGT